MRYFLINLCLCCAALYLATLGARELFGLFVDYRELFAQ